LDVVAEAICLLNFYSGLSMCLATGWIISGLRNRRKNDTAPVPELFSWTCLQLWSSWFSCAASAPEITFYMAPAPTPVSGHFHTLIFCLRAPQVEWKMNQIKFTKLREYTKFFE